MSTTDWPIPISVAGLAGLKYLTSTYITNEIQVPTDIIIDIAAETFISGIEFPEPRILRRSYLYSK